MEKEDDLRQTAVPEAEVDLMAQFDQYLARQTKPVQVMHKGLFLSTAAGLGFLAAVLVKAIIVSIGWPEVNGMEIAFWWMTFAASILPFCIFFGLDVILLRAVPPITQTGKGGEGRITTGYRAVLGGLVWIAAGLAWAGFIAAILYSTLTLNMDVLETAVNIFVAVIVLGAAVQFFPTLVRDLTRTLTR